MPAARNAQEVILQVLAEFKIANGELSALRSEMEAFKTDLELITKIVRGDGIVQSLVTQVELMKNELGHITAAINDCETKVEELRTRADQFISDDRQGRWTLIAAVVTGITGLIGSIIAALIAIYKD